MGAREQKGTKGKAGGGLGGWDDDRNMVVIFEKDCILLNTFTLAMNC